MSTFFASALFLVMVLGDVCTEKYHQAPTKEASTTFLRLTALRTDEGLWTARFGDYEISIELKHHPSSRRDANYNDTWTLKVKHMHKYSILQDEKLESPGNGIHGEVIQEPSFHTTETRETWKKIMDGIDDNDEEDSPVFRKIHPPKIKPKKVKARRQLSTRSFASTTETNDRGLGETLPAYSNDPSVMKELAQGSNRLNVFFDSEDGNGVDKFDEEYEEVNEKPWKNIAAVIYDGMSNSPVVKNKTEEETEVGNNNTPIVERLTDSYALPLQQSSRTDDYDDDTNISLAQDIANPQDFNPDTMEVPDDVIVEGLGKPTRNNSEEIESVDVESTSLGQDIDFNPETWEDTKDVTVEDSREENSRKDSQEINGVNSEQSVERDQDYVIEDTSAGNTDEDVGSEAESGEVDFSELEVPPEMKRIMEWYPRSKPLTTENNGYKLFPGVGWFKLVPWAERWSNARKVCESEMAYLAIPDSKQKVKIFQKIFKYYPDVLEQSILSNQVYVGVYSRGLHRNLTTVKDQPFQPRFSIWFPGEPDNADPGEDCVTFHVEGKIRDVPCFYNLPFLCEKEPDIS